MTASSSVNSMGLTTRVTVSKFAQLILNTVHSLVMQELRSRSSRNGVRVCVLHLPSCRQDGIVLHPAWFARLPLWSCRLLCNRADQARMRSIPFLSLQRRQDTCSFQPRLFEDAVECAGSEIITHVAGDCDSARLRRMLLLPMTATCGNHIPSVGLDHLDRLPNFHPQNIS